MDIIKQTKTVAAAALIAVSLGGCAAALIGGAALGGKSAADRRTTGTQADDEIMEMRIKNTALSQLRQKRNRGDYLPKLAVVSYNRNVLLLGQVTSEEDRRFVEQTARAQQPVKNVYNYITVATPMRTYREISSDTWSTSKVRTSLLGLRDGIAARVKIVTYERTTYIMGVLTPEEQETVTRRVSTTAGVQKVVTLYEDYGAAAQGAQNAQPEPVYPPYQPPGTDAPQPQPVQTPQQPVQPAQPVQQ